MAGTREDATTTDDHKDAPRLSIAGPLLTAIASLATGVATFVSACLLIEVPDRNIYEARLVARPGEVRLTARAADTIRAIHVADGQRVRTGDLVVSLATDALSAKRQRLVDDANRMAERLAALRLDLGNAPSADADEGSSGIYAARRARIADIESALWSINRQMTTIENDLRLAAIRAPADGRVAGMAGLAPGVRLEPGATFAVIVPDRTSAIVEVAAPLDVRAASAPLLAYRLAQPARLRLPVPARLLAGDPEIDASGVRRGAPTRIEIEDPSGGLDQYHPGDVVAHIAFDAGTTKPIINLLLTGSAKEHVVAAPP